MITDERIGNKDAKVFSPNEVAAALSLIAFETGGFKYDTNHYPGRPGQGTRNMQMGGYNVLYALRIEDLKAQRSLRLRQL